MSTKKIGILATGLIAILGSVGCNKPPQLKPTAPTAVVEVNSTGTSKAGICASISVANQTNVYGYDSTDVYGNPITTDQYNVANLSVGFSYNIHDPLYNTDTFAPAIDPLTGLVAAPTPSFSTSVGPGVQSEIDITYNGAWLQPRGAMTFYGPLTLQVVDQNGVVKSALKTYNIVPNFATSEGICGSIVVYWITNGGSAGYVQDSGLRTTGGSSTIALGLTSTVYNVRADVVAEATQTATQGKYSETWIQQETSRRIVLLKEIVHSMVENTLATMMAGVKHPVEYANQLNRSDTTAVEAAIKTSAVVQAKQAGIYTPAFQRAMDEVARHYR